MHIILLIIIVIVFIVSIFISVNSMNKSNKSNKSNKFSLSTSIYSDKFKSIVPKILNNCDFIGPEYQDRIIIIKDQDKYIGVGFIKKDSKRYIQSLPIDYEILPDKNYWFFHTLCILDKYRGKKICSNLIIPYLIKLAKKYAIDFIILDVDQDNIKAQKCYTNNHFKIIAEYLFNNTIPRYVMSYNLLFSR